MLQIVDLNVTAAGEPILIGLSLTICAAEVRNLLGVSLNGSLG